MDSKSIRLADENDLSAIATIAVESGLFAAESWSGVEEVLRSVLTGESPGQVWVSVEARSVVGGAYVAPEPFAESMWNLYFLAVSPASQGSGAGSGLVRHVENDARRAGVRTLIIETSGTDEYASTRSFYDGLGYSREARIRDFYGPGDDKVVYSKFLTAPAPALEVHELVAVVGAGVDGRLSVWNEAAEALIGYASSAVLGREITTIVPLEYHDQHVEGFRRAMAGGARNSDGGPLHLPVRCSDGTVHVFATRFLVLDDPAGNPCGAIVVMTRPHASAEPWTPVESEWRGAGA